MKKIIFLICPDHESTCAWLKRLYPNFENDADVEIHIMSKFQNTAILGSNFKTIDKSRLIPIVHSLVMRGRLYGYCDSMDPGVCKYEIVLNSKMLNKDRYSSELFIALYRLEVWHFADIYVVRDNDECVIHKNLPSWFNFTLVNEYHIRQKYWSGCLGLTLEDEQFIPLCKLRIFVNLQRKLTILSPQQRFYVSPLMEILSPIEPVDIPLGFSSSLNKFRGEIPFGCSNQTKEFLQTIPVLCRIAYSIDPPEVIPDNSFPTASYKTEHWLSMLKNKQNFTSPKFNWKIPFGYVYFLLYWSKQSGKITLMEMENILELASQIKEIDPTGNFYAYAKNSRANEDLVLLTPSTNKGRSFYDTPKTFDQSSMAMIDQTHPFELEHAFLQTGCKAMLSFRENDSSAIVDAKRTSGNLMKIKSYMPFFLLDMGTNTSKESTSQKLLAIEEESPDRENVPIMKSVTYSTVNEDLDNHHYFKVVRSAVDNAMQDHNIAKDDKRFTYISENLFLTVLTLYEALPCHLLNTEKIIAKMAAENIVKLLEKLSILEFQNSY
ncbi:hypothetical protein GJ496_011648 [Pomphorhynchus laevis]|nr:hypothetical protein GJ496_011648 [Pomphorhynchus laevis]